MRRRKLLVALGGPAVVVVAWAVVLWPRPNRITWDNYGRACCDGMTRPEVYAILGPPGDYRTGPVEGCESPTYRVGYIEGRPAETWVADTTGCAFLFDSAGRMQMSQWVSCRPVSQTPLDNLLWRAKRQWHRWFP
jgi:hypothetical protein